MEIRHATLVFSLTVVLLLVLACGNEPPPLKYTGYLTEEIPPCIPVAGSTTDPCEPNVSSAIYGLGQYSSDDSVPLTVPEMLAGNPPPAYTTHLVLRGTYLPNTIRCTVGESYRPPSYLGSDFTDPTQRSVKCYADVRTNAYIIGSGPLELTTLLYRFPYWEGEFDENDIEELRQSLAFYMNEEFPGREHVMFLGPPVDLSSEAWRLIGWWDVQRQEDSTVVAVYNTSISEVKIELTAFTQAVTAAHQDRLTEYDGRIGEDEDLPDLVTDANNLRDYYVEVGAYDEGEPTPSQPPPPCGLVVPDQADNPGLMRDCMVLLAAKDALRGTAALNWSVDTAITGWDGVTVEGTLKRVTKLKLANKGLTGMIPEDLEKLDALTEIRLSGNSLTGCIPIALRDVATNDLSSLNLPYCQPPAPGAPTAGTAGETSVPLSWTAVSNTSKYRVEYREGTVGPWTVDDNAITTTSHTVDGLQCEIDHEIRVSAYGDGVALAASWGETKQIKRTLGSCTPPTFGADSYSFTVPDDAPKGTAVGTVTATDASPPVVFDIIWFGRVLPLSTASVHS